MFSQKGLRRNLSLGTVVLVSSLFLLHFVAFNFLGKPSILGLVVFNVFFALALWSYLATSLTDPGTEQTAEWRRWASERAPKEPPPDGTEFPRGWRPGEPAFCRKCDAWRPERAHHCSNTGTCVLRFDHFCGWTGNCIGWRNHKQFVLMNFYIFCACLTLIAELSPGTFGPMLGGVDGASLLDTREPPTAWTFMHPIMMSTAIVCATVFCLAGALFWFFEICHASSNASAAERLYKGPNPYQLPTTKENLQQLFGKLDFFLLLPTVADADGRGNDGTSFPYFAAAAAAQVPGSYGATV